MGAYLSTPIRDKVSDDAETKLVKYGASSMQGWRVSQEDAHNCLPEFDTETKTSLFAVYDGHGGAEVAEYTAAKLPDYLKGLTTYKDGRLAQALEDSFMGFDALLTRDEVMAELQELAGTTPDHETAAEQAEEAKALAEEADMPISDLLERYGGPNAGPNAVKAHDILDEESEANALVEESCMPLQSLLQRYGGAANNPVSKLRNGKSNKFQSPVLRPKKGGQANGSGDASENGDDAVKMSLESKMTNGHSENENNENAEKEAKMAVDADTEAQSKPESTTDSDVKAESKTDAKSNGEASISTDSKTEQTTNNVSSSTESQGSSGATAVAAGSSAQQSASSNSTEPSSSTDCKPQSSSTGSSSSSGEVCSSSGGSSGSAGGSSSSSGDSAGVGSSSGAGGSSLSTGNEEPGSSSGRTRTKRKNVIPAEGEHESSEDEEDTEDEDEDDSEDEDQWLDADSDEEGDSEEDEDDDCEVMCGGEEPGVDSGCTAVVALLRGPELFVANAGDSRCVVSRGGKALDMSIDHKPEDKPESDRITKAGGRVTADGRVNGGLNLSRAIGDHCYKKNEAVSDREQMITALPDVKCITLQENDDFMILACDGIWNVMTSQEAVDFVKELLTAGKNKLSEICELMFDFCLSPNTDGDGSGCDNMTCVIVTFNHKQLQEIGSLKRRASNGNADEPTDSKVSKTEDSAASEADAEQT